MVKRTFLVFGWLVVTAALGCGRLDTTSFEEGLPNPLAFTALDVDERSVQVGYPSERVFILFFSSPETSDAMQPLTADIAIHFREANDLEFVTIVDLRNLAFYERPFAPGAIHDAGMRTIGRINRRLDELGYDPIEGLEDHLFMITDDSGGITDTYGVPDPTQYLTCIVFEHSGQEAGRFDPATQLEEVIAAIEQVQSDSVASD